MVRITRADIRNLTRVIREELDARKINAEQQGLQSEASLGRLLVDLNQIVDQMMTVLGPEETAQELEGIADEIYRGTR